MVDDAPLIVDAIALSAEQQEQDSNKGSNKELDSTMTHKRASAAAALSNSSQRSEWPEFSSPVGEPIKPGHKDGAVLAPILVTCSGSGSDEGDSSSPDQGSMPSCISADMLGTGKRQEQQQEKHQRISIASTLDGTDSSSMPGEPVPATWIAEADMQAGCYKTGVRYCLETWPRNFILQGLDAFLAMSSMFGYTATILLILVLGTTAWVTSCWPLGIFTTALVVSVFLPAEPLLWNGFQHSTLVSSWRRYFSFSFVLDSKLDPMGRYVFAAFPHGVFPVSELLCISLMLRIWPKLRVYSICASSVFKVPVWRHILCWTGARPATAADFRALLQRGSVSLVPGGIAEMFLWEEDREVIKIRERKGFVRIAVETGTPLVPVYHFGNSKLFSWVAPSWLEGVSRRARMAVGYPKGRWGTLMPCNAPLFMAVGSPIPVPCISPGEEGFEDAVDRAHEQLMRGLEELYHKYKGMYGWGSRDLVVN